MSTNAGTVGTLFIGSDGSMNVWDAGATGSASEDTSLARISFPAGLVAVQPMPLNAAWQSAWSGYGTGSPSYIVTDSLSHLAGSTTITRGAEDARRAAHHARWSDVPVCGDTQSSLTSLSGTSFQTSS